MTDKATMPEEVWISPTVNPKDFGSDIYAATEREAFGGSSKYILASKYKTLAAVAGRMAEALEKAGIDLHESEKNAVLSSYNALMKGR